MSSSPGVGASPVSARSHERRVAERAVLCGYAAAALAAAAVALQWRDIG